MSSDSDDEAVSCHNDGLVNQEPDGARGVSVDATAELQICMQEFTRLMNL